MKIKVKEDLAKMSFASFVSILIYMVIQVVWLLMGISGIGQHNIIWSSVFLIWGGVLAYVITLVILLTRR